MILLIKICNIIKFNLGTKGDFAIIINSNNKLNYKICFKSLNVKPQNLKFKCYFDRKEIDVDKLEDLSEKLSGRVNKNSKIININWYWNYEEKNLENQYIFDKKDTEDAKFLKNYRFRIEVVGDDNDV